MSKLTAIRKQIAALEAEATRIGQAEIKGAIAKVKEIMAEFGLTIEHLSGAISKVAQKAAGKKTPTKPAKRAGVGVGVGVAKYADPKTGKTWTGFGRAPAWIATAKSRDAFLVTKNAAAAQSPIKATAPAKKAKAVAAKKASPVKVAKAVKTAKAVAAPAPAAKAPKTKKAAASKKVSPAEAPVAKKKSAATAKKVAAKKSATSATADSASAASAPAAA